jgi:uncharacterized protein with NRDE domain
MPLDPINGCNATFQVRAVMCLILVAWRVRADAPLIVAANRDEFYARPALAAHRWHDAPAIFAGRDVQAGGTWLGVSAQGRFAAVTNFSETPAEQKPGSRGELVRQFLEGQVPAMTFAQQIERSRYAGFSLVLFDGRELVYTSNREGGPYPIEPGVHGLANTHLNARWPKLRRGVKALERATAGPLDTGCLLRILADEHQPEDWELPQRGRELAFERRVAPCFIRGEQYGTRASTVVIMGGDQIQFTEQAYGPLGEPLACTSEALPLSS